MGAKQVKALSLRDIIQFEIPPLFRWQHLNRDMIIIFVGDRGDGKSMGTGITAVVDYMLQGEPCFSNEMEIAARFQVDDATAAKYGMRGGYADFRSQPLNMAKFLFDTETHDYDNSVIVVEEINIAMADARRSMSNQNLAADDAGQQIRKFRSALIGNCIHEMFLDNRIRDMVDIFVRTKDLALTPEGLAARQKPGKEFEWTIYPMTRKLTGETYSETGETITVTINGESWWGIVNTFKKQKRKKISRGISDEEEEGAEETGIDLREGPRLTAAKSKWGWLQEAVLELHNQGFKEISNYDLWDYLQIDERGVSKSQVGEQLRHMGFRKKKASPSVGGYIYIINDFDLEKGNLDSDRKVAELVRS